MRTNVMKQMALMIGMVWLAFQVPAIADTGLTVHVEPEEIHIGTFYNGMELTASGTVPAGSDVILRFASSPSELHLRQKGKVLGLIWMNKDILKFMNVPNVCLVHSSKPFDDLGADADSFRIESTFKAVKIEAMGEKQDFDASRELLRLKQKEGLCAESIGGFTLGQETNGTQSFKGSLHLPPSLAPGPYRVEAVAVKDGVQVGKTEIPIEVKLVGAPAWLSNLAFQHGALYGILASIIAILGGMVISLFFQSKGAH